MAFAVHGAVFLHQGFQLGPCAIAQRLCLVAHAVQVEGLHADAIDRFADVVALGCCLGSIEDFEGLADERVAVDLVVLADVDAVVHVGLDEALTEIVVRLDVWSGLAVVATNEDADERIDVLLGVPEELIDGPGFHLVELSPCRLVLCLLEDADGVVVAKDPDVGSQHLEVGPRRDVLGIIDDVVPDEEVRCYLGPAFEVAHECFVLRTTGIEGMCEAALDAAETDDDILSRLDARGRLARILIGKGADELVGELVANGIGHLIDEPDDQS